MKLTDKIAIVVGAGSGIGKATAKLLAREGATVVAVDRDFESVKKTAEEIITNGNAARAVGCDMTREQETIKMVQTSLDMYGQVDILVNVAGGAVGKYIRDKMKPFAESSREEWDEILEVNLNGARNCTRAVIGHMISRNSGKIVNFSSISELTALLMPWIILRLKLPSLVLQKL